MLRALLVRHPHIDKILNGNKTWEIRGSRTRIRGTIGLIASGSGTVIGVCDVVDCIGPLTQDQYEKNASKAGIQNGKAKLGYYRQTYAWVLENPKYLKKSVPYKHPAGAVIWVTLDPDVERGIRTQLDDSAQTSVPTPSVGRDPFGNLRIVSVKYDGLNPDRYEEGEFVGLVVKVVENRMKVFFPYEDGQNEIAWLTRHRQDRWIDKTWSAIVTVEDANPSQREAVQRYISKERLLEVLDSERRG